MRCRLTFEFNWAGFRRMPGPVVCDELMLGKLQGEGSKRVG